MKVITGPGPVRLALVCGVHGDERFGVEAWKSFEQEAADRPGLQLILANEEAVRADCRYIDSDLNRSFPGNPAGGHEERLASELGSLLKEAACTVDIHTTTSDLQRVLIATSVRHAAPALAGCAIPDVMEMGHAPYSLIGNAQAGVSVEFGESYAASPEALAEVRMLVKRILEDEKPLSTPRRIYSDITTIPLGMSLPKGSRNFEFSGSLGGYPLLLHEKAYRNHHQGFLAREVRKRD